jgi:protein-S-isoprenylcysteine O-methyltransferase Ste14
MTAQPPTAPAGTEETATGGFTPRAVLSFLLIVVLLPLVLFLAAGTWTWTAAWVYVVAHWAGTFLSRVLAWRANPDLLAERGKSVEKGLGQGRDRPLLLVGALLGPLAIWIVAGLDERLGWSPDLSLALQAVAGGLLVAGYAFSTWAFAANAYFSAVIRIQEDRGQTVVTGGPYRLVRHPGYAGGIVVYLAMPLLLDSLWALIPTAITVGAVVMRTALEDTTLKESLAGYVEYADRTRFRLLPGIW